MILHLKKGMKCWAIVELDGYHCPVPVTIADIDGILYTVRWTVTEGFVEEHRGLTDRDLFQTENHAWDHIIQAKEKEKNARGKAGAKAEGVSGRKDIG